MVFDQKVGESLTTKELKAHMAYWLGWTATFSPAWLLPILEWLSLKFAGKRCLSPLHGHSDHVDAHVPKLKEVVAIRFVCLKMDLTNREIDSLLSENGLRPLLPEELDLVADKHPETLPLSHRVIATGGNGDHVRVIWRGDSQINRFWFRRDVTHIPGDYAAGAT